MNTYKEEIMIEAKKFNSKVKKEPKLRYSEAFYSVQGEGRFVGVPSIFLRTFGCNFTCGGFGMPRGELSNERFKVDGESFLTAIRILVL